MTGNLALAGILVCAPVGLFVVNAIVSRALRYCGKASVPPQFVSLCTALAGNLPVLYFAWGAALKNLAGHPLDLFCGLAYVVLTYNCCCYLYFCILNLSETSLHVNILMRLLISGGTRQEELAGIYGVKDMIGARIDRMIALGQLKEQDGRYVTGNRTLVLIGRVVNIWRRILSLPLSPP
jgi:hypothetical protein